MWRDVLRRAGVQGVDEESAEVLELENTFLVDSRYLVHMRANEEALRALRGTEAVVHREEEGSVLVEDLGKRLRGWRPLRRAERFAFSDLEALRLVGSKLRRVRDEVDAQGLPRARVEAPPEGAPLGERAREVFARLAGTEREERAVLRVREEEIAVTEDGVVLLRVGGLVAAPWHMDFARLHCDLWDRPAQFYSALAFGGRSMKPPELDAQYLCLLSYLELLPRYDAQLHRLFAARLLYMERTVALCSKHNLHTSDRTWIQDERFEVNVHIDGSATGGVNWIYTAVRWAVYSNDVERLEALLRVGASPDAICCWNVHGNIHWRPLGWAIAHRRLRCLKVLLMHGARLDLPFTYDSRPFTPMEYCNRHNKEKCKAIIREFEAFQKSRASLGFTWLLVAQRLRALPKDLVRLIWDLVAHDVESLWEDLGDDDDPRKGGRRPVDPPRD